MTSGMRRFREPRTVVRAGERCEMCTAAITDEHGHVVNLSSRALQCACRPCYLLFTSASGARGKYRSVPQRYRYDPRFTLADEMWAATGIPVNMAFLFRNTEQAGTVAFYPSPAGATESVLPADTLDGLLADNPAFADLEPDVEALLLVRGEAGFEAFLVPIDACYELVAHVRLHWTGFDGGPEAWSAIDGFFATLRDRSENIAVKHG
jgi:hypothetical protein